MSRKRAEEACNTWPITKTETLHQTILNDPVATKVNGDDIEWRASRESMSSLWMYASSCPWDLCWWWKCIWDVVSRAIRLREFALEDWVFVIVPRRWSFVTDTFNCCMVHKDEDRWTLDETAFSSFTCSVTLDNFVQGKQLSPLTNKHWDHKWGHLHQRDLRDRWLYRETNLQHNSSCLSLFLTHLPCDAKW